MSSLGNPLDPSISMIEDYDTIIKEEFSVVEPDMFSEGSSWPLKEEDKEESKGVSDLIVVPSEYEGLNPDVIVPDLFQDLADLSPSDIFDELAVTSSQVDSMSTLSTDRSTTDSLQDQLTDFLGSNGYLIDAETLGAASTPEDEDEEGLRSDIMWSSACLNEESIPASIPSSKRPRRDSTLSLMECAQNLFREFELSGFPFMDTPLPSSEDDEEEEIDVVSTFELQQSNSHHIHHPHIHHKVNHHFKAGNASRLRTHPGRSLLKSQQQHQFQQQSTPVDHGWGDHIYHSGAQPAASSAQPPMGILTPTESEDDEESIIQSSSSNNKANPTIVKAVQSLMNNNNSNNLNSPTPSSSKDNVKFKFRMKFKSGGNSNGESPPSSEQSSLLRSSCKRKSASNNTYCPPPINASSLSPSKTASRLLNESSSSKKTLSNNSSTGTHSNSSSSSSPRQSVSEAKCREVRDLHNSMERQRRVDLRNNFDQLKVVVPELKDAEKASKLNILNKSAEYCKYLTSIDSRLRKEKEQLMSRNAALTQRLSQLKYVLDRRAQQHRLSEKRNNSSSSNSSNPNNNSHLIPHPIRTLA